ncbi:MULTISPECIES: XdhC family protein [unclassified Roseitalea]|uniref:XdhC family protein n=1 Tax=unclassified Roseitalea TaxID=2639107 RepID=UPI00273EA63D|nr:MULTISPECIES: XdhC family protein [unclassified Roseitalea]
MRDAPAATAADFGPDSAPLAVLAAARTPGVLAVITGVEGPSYRPLGAMMAFAAAGGQTGSLSSGCVEADLAIHAQTALGEGRPLAVRYGRGSPFIDIQLPCGGGLEILLVPDPDRAVLDEVCGRLAARGPITLRIDADSGALGIDDAAATGWQGTAFAVHLQPELQFLTFGKGPEASTFAALARSAGYRAMLLSPDEETLAHGRQAGCATRHLARRAMPADIAPDGWTAVTLFFHDHDWEPPIIEAVLESPAFYIGAQGSRRARQARDLDLEARGVAREAIARVRGPIGLIASARDPRTLAVSVIAEILDAARQARLQA